MLKADYDKFAEQFSKTRQLPWKEAVDFLENLPKNSEGAKTRRHKEDLKTRGPEDIRILDIGCGNGRHLIEAEKCGLNAVGLDISKNLLKIAKRKTHASLILGNALALPFKNGAFDNSICIAVVHHFKTEKERIQALKDAARISRSAILVSVWAFEQEKFAKRKSQDIQLCWDRKFPRFYHLFKEGELESLAEKSGLRVKKRWRSGGNYWAVVKIKDS